MVGWASRRDLPSANALGNPKGEAEHAPRVFRDGSGNPMCVCSSLTIELPCSESVYGARAPARGWRGAGGCEVVGPGYAEQAVEEGVRPRPPHEARCDDRVRGLPPTRGGNPDESTDAQVPRDGLRGAAVR